MFLWGSWKGGTSKIWTRVGAMNRSESPSTALRAPSPPLGEKDGMRGVRFMERTSIKLARRIGIPSPHSFVVGRGIDQRHVVVARCAPGRRRRIFLFEQRA